MEMGMKNFRKMEFTPSPPFPPAPTIRNLRVMGNRKAYCYLSSAKFIVKIESSKKSTSSLRKFFHYGVFSGPYIPVFGVNTKIYSVYFRIRSKYRKIGTRENSIFGHFSRSAFYLK